MPDKQHNDCTQRRTDQSRALIMSIPSNALADERGNERPGDPDVRKSVHLHVNYGLLADIFGRLAATAAQIPADEPHRDMLIEQLTALHRAVKAR